MQRFKELNTLLNAGYPISMGIGFLVLPIHYVVKLILRLIDGGNLPSSMLVGTFVIFIIGFSLGTLLIKIGIEAKKE